MDARDSAKLQCLSERVSVEWLVGVVDGGGRTNNYLALSLFRSFALSLFRSFASGTTDLLRFNIQPLTCSGSISNH